MGGANNICSDKTGTLTMNQMTVTHLWKGNFVEFNTDHQSYQTQKYFPSINHSSLFFECGACNTHGSIKNTNATERAIINILKKFDVDIEGLRNKHLEDQFIRFQFTSKRKKMSTILTSIRDNEHGYDKRLHIKGAAEIVLDSCSKYINADGDIVELTDQFKQEIIDTVIGKYAKDSLRTICLAYKDLKENEGGPTHELEDGVNKVVEMSELTCIAILGIRDVIRPEVPLNVKICQEAHIRVRMVTGDNKNTAIAIARECNIITSNHVDSVMEGPEFNKRVGGLKP